MISKEKKQAIMAEYARTPGDTGSPEVQVAVLTEHLETQVHLRYRLQFLQQESMS